jgi:predicted permease
VTPPRLADRLLVTRLAPDERDELLGDLHEQFASRVHRDGLARARRWYWRQALALAWGFSVRRRDTISRDHTRMRGRWLLENLGTDVRFAWRSLRHSPSFSVVAALTLTFGIGLSTAMFSFVNGILLDPLPYAHGERIVQLVDVPTAGPGSGSTAGTAMSDVSIGAWAATETDLDALAPYGDNIMTVILPSGALSTRVGEVSAAFFDVLAMPPLAGRVLGAGDMRREAPPAAVISERLARQSYGGPQAAIGQTIGIESTVFQVVGVLPAAFAFPSRDIDAWRPGPQYRRYPLPGERRNVFMRSTVIGRLKPGRTMDDLAQSGRRVAQTLQAALVDAGDLDAELLEFRARRLIDDIAAPVKPALLLLAAGTAIVLLAACINLANLLLTRATARQRELAVRLALGAGRWRVSRPVLVELLMLAAAGGAAGAVLAWWLLRGAPALAPAAFPRIENIHFDVRALCFAFGAAFLTALVAGWLPSLHVSSASSPGIQELSAGHGRTRVGRQTRSGEWLRSALVGGQVTLAMALLVVAMLIGRSFARLLDEHLGYRPEGVVTMQAAQTLANAREPGRLRQYYTELIARLERAPGVTAVGYAAALPMHEVMIKSGVTVVGRAVDPTANRFDESRMAIHQPVSRGYLDAVGTRIVQGRGFTAADTATSEKVVIIDETIAARTFPDGDALGQQLRWGQYEWRIVGVAEAMRLDAPGQAPPAMFYFNTDHVQDFVAFARQGAGIAVRTTGDLSALAAFIRDTARAVDPQVPVFNVQPLTVDVRASVAQPRFFTVVLGLFAALALSTALLGVYGVLAYAVERRRLEFGIRRALGATERDMAALVAARAGVLTLAGIVIGAGVAWLGGRYLGALLYGITPLDAPAYAVSIGAVVLVAAVAAWAPMRRALAVDPAVALRSS